MNNPFLSDRNIFSKVVNPIRKKEEKKEEGKEQGKVVDRVKESKVESYGGFRNEKIGQGVMGGKGSVEKPRQKMTFGVPSEPEKRTVYENRYNTNPNPNPNPNTKPNPNPNLNFNPNHRKSYQSESESEVQQTYNYLKSGPQRTYSGDTNPTPLDKYKSIPRQQILSPPHEYKFEEYRKSNNLNNISPINPQVNNMADSQFLNIDALGDDLNRFLAESKNQDQLCKILGIERTNKKEQAADKVMVGSKAGFRDRPEVALRDSKPYYEVNPTFASTQTPKVPAIFSKERKVEMAKTEQMASFKPQQSLRTPNDHVPTFNYMGLDLQNSTTSNHQSELGHFRASSPPQKPAPKEKQSDNLQVFNYSKVDAPKKSDSLQQQIAKEMTALSISGKYRTFLSSSEKVVTYQYKLQPL